MDLENVPNFDHNEISIQASGEEMGVIIKVTYNFPISIRDQQYFDFTT